MAEQMVEKEWLRHLLPLPHEISIKGQIDCEAAEIAIKLRADAGPVERQAAAELEQLLTDRTGVSPRGGGFEIHLGVVAPGQCLGRVEIDTLRLGTLPHKEQAYIMQPRDRDGLVLAGLDERGVYYAVRTLCQLLEVGLGADRVVMPLPQVVAWPDMEERGLWNFPAPEEWIGWMAGMKLNYGKMASTQLEKVVRGKRNHAHIDGELLQRARLQGFNYTPYILHLNFLADCGLFEAYPELAGVGNGALAARYFAHKSGDQHRAPCASNPLLVEILAEWIEDVASQGAPEVSCWLSERPAQCGCASCTAAGQFVLEARAFVAAWQKVRCSYPDFEIRLFLSTTTAERDHQVVAEAPPEVKIERACATEMERVLRQPRDLMSNPLLDYYAAQGRWIASYDVPIGAYGRVDTPEFKVPERAACRIRDYVGQLHRRSYRGAYGMMAWATLGEEICGYNIHALAEWSWNAEGRSEGEFAEAWAIRVGYGNPEAVGEWAALMGPVEFDVYDSDFPICYSWGKAIEMVRQHQRPLLGEGMFRYYAEVDDFERKKEICRRALQLVEGGETSALYNETQVVFSYVELARCIYQVAEQVAMADLGQRAEREKLQLFSAQLEAAGSENGDALKVWRSDLGPEPWHYRVHDALEAVAATVREVNRFVSERYFY